MDTTNQERIAKVENAVAFEYGRLAFLKGIRCAPVLDANWMAMIEGRKAGTCKELGNAWQRGWTNENLNPARRIDLFSLENEHIATVVTTGKTSQEIVNAIVTAGFNPLLYTWKEAQC